MKLPHTARILGALCAALLGVACGDRPAAWDSPYQPGSDAQGKRPIYGDNALLQSDPHFRDYVLFYEYFHGDNGRGLGAPHQTGWTGLIAKLLMPRQKEG